MVGTRLPATACSCSDACTYPHSCVPVLMYLQLAFDPPGVDGMLVSMSKLGEWVYSNETVTGGSQKLHIADEQGVKFQVSAILSLSCISSYFVHLTLSALLPDRLHSTGISLPRAASPFLFSFRSPPHLLHLLFHPLALSSPCAFSCSCGRNLLLHRWTVARRR